MATVEKPHLVAIYGRVSTGAQEVETQLLALRAHVAHRGWQVVEEFVDIGFSGSRERRPALDRLMRAAWDGRFQVVLVWRFDRFARSVKHLVSALDTFRSCTSLSSRSRSSSTRRAPSARRCSRSSARWPSSKKTSSSNGSAPASRGHERRAGAWAGLRCTAWMALALRGEGRSLRAVARELNVHPMAVRRALSRASQIPSANAA